MCVVASLPLSYCSALKSLKLTEEHVAKVVKDRIFSAAFHPSVSQLLVAAGDKWGKVGLWSLVSRDVLMERELNVFLISGLLVLAV